MWFSISTGLAAPVNSGLNSIVGRGWGGVWMKMSAQLDAQLFGAIP
jgi:hypothetical protein